MPLANHTDISEPVPFQNTGKLAPAITQVAGYDEIIVTNTTQALRVDTYQTRFTTGHANSVATLPAGLFPGQRKVVTCTALGAGGQELVLTPGAGVTWTTGANNVVSNTFDAADEFLLVEWNGAKWVTLNGTATEANDG